MEIGALDGKDSLFYKSEYPNANVYTIEGIYDNYQMIDITSVNISQGKQHDSVWLNKKFL